MGVNARIQELERRASSFEAKLLSQPVERRQLNGTNFRLARTTSGGNGNQFNIEFINQTFPLATGQQNATTTVRHPDKPVCRNILNDMPPVGTELIVYYLRDRWFTMWCGEKTVAAPSYVDCLAGSGTFADSFDDGTINRSMQGNVEGTTQTPSGGMLVSDNPLGTGAQRYVRIAHCLNISGWPVGGTTTLTGSTVGANFEHVFLGSTSHDFLQLGGLRVTFNRNPGTVGDPGSAGQLSVIINDFQGFANPPAREEFPGQPVPTNIDFSIAATRTNAADMDVTYNVNGTNIATRTYQFSQFGALNDLITFAIQSTRTLQPPNSTDLNFGVPQWQLVRTW